MEFFILFALIICLLLTFVAVFFLLRYISKNLRLLTQNKPYALLNMSSVVEQTASFKQAHAQLEEYSASIVGKLRVLQSEGKKVSAPIEEHMETLTKLYASSVDSYEKRINLLIAETIQKAIETLSVQEKLDIVLPTSSALFYNKHIDITEKIVKILSTTEIEIPPIPDIE